MTFSASLSKKHRFHHAANARVAHLAILTRISAADHREQSDAIDYDRKAVDRALLVYRLGRLKIAGQA